MLTLPVVSGVQKFQALRADRSVVAGDCVGDDRSTSTAAAIATPSRTPPRRGAAASRRPSRPAVRSRRLDARDGRSGVEPLLPTLMLVWLAGVAMLSLRLLTGWMWVQRLRTHGVTAAGDAWQPHGGAARRAACTSRARSRCSSRRWSTCRR